MSFRWLDKLSGEKEKSSYKSSWWEENWGTLTCLVGVFIIALFLRIYFAFELATKFGTPYLLSGGSDAYYYERIINYVAENHQHLLFDPLRKYPFGAGNPRPPIYGWSVVLGGYLIYPFIGSMNQAISYSFILSTGIWGALTIFPVYLIGRDTFGKKAGLAGAFLLAISSGHLQRSMITNGDHDAIYLFFAVTAFYFFMRSLRDIPENERWVSDWTDWPRIKKGLRDFLVQNKRSLLYAALSGMSIAAVALTWKGYPYVMVIILVYFAFQLIIDKFQNKDSLGITACIGITMAVAFLVAGPYYIGADLGSNLFSGFLTQGLGKWFDTPLLMFLVAFAVGVFFTVTRDLPWLLIFTILGIAGAVYIALGSFVLPGLLKPLTSAGGYFIQNKLYSTIAEAQAPPFSNIVLSFGILTFFLSFVGIGLAAWHLIGNWRRPFIFVLIWTAFAIYMATSAARFIFNSSPAFAVTAGWVIALLIDKTNFSIISQRFRKFRGDYIRAMKEGIKIKHILVVLTVIFLIMMPNVLYAFDAGIPYTDKKEYNDQIYNSLPNAMRPDEYNVSSQNYWYLGAFGYSMDRPIDYWPAAWDWYSQQDKELDPEERPAFLSWWDYGFECIKEGKHPTVADNFQVGYRLAGNVLMAQNESEVISLLIVRELELPISQDGEFEGDIENILIEHVGEEKTEELQQVMKNYDDPKYKQKVLNNPDKYHPRADDIHPENVKYAYTMGLLAEEGKDTLASMYRSISLELDKRIKYLAVDSRLFPKSATNTGIFYAPAKLAGYRVEEKGGSRSPVDFYSVKLVGSNGQEYDSREDVPEGIQITDYRLNLKPMFYNTTLYRVFAGYSGKEVGAQQGIPGLDQLGGRQARQQYQPMPGWGYEQFSLTYKTAYYNPYEDYENHTDAWRAISDEKAKRYSNQGKGTVDRTARSYMNQGVVFLEYHDGAILKGTVETTDGQPIPNARVTVLDEDFIPHDYGYTDSKGRYEVILPEGNNSVIVSNGGSGSKLIKTETNSLGQAKVNVTDQEAMRERVDKDLDGIWDYKKKKDFEVDTANITGKVYIDNDGDGEYNKNNDTLVSSDVIIENKTVGVRYTVDASNGTYIKHDVMPGKYNIRADVPGTSERTGVMFETLGELERDIEIKTGQLKGNYSVDEEIEKTEFTLELDNINNDRSKEISIVKGEDNNYTFENVIHGTYRLTVADRGYCLKQGPITLQIEQESEIDQSISISKAHEVTFRAVRDDKPIKHQKLSIYDKEGMGYSRTVTTDETGEITIKLPESTYRIYGQYQKDSINLVHMGTVTVNEDTEFKSEFEKAYRVKGTVKFSQFPQSQFNLLFSNRDDAEKQAVAKTYTNGQFSIDLVEGSYTVYGWKKTTSQKKFSLDEVNIDSSRQIEINAYEGETVEGSIYRDLNHNGEFDQGEGVKANIELESSEKSIELTSLKDGTYSLVMPDTKSDLILSKEGYSTVTKTYRPGKEFESNIPLRADNVTVKGDISFTDIMVDGIHIKFEALGNGAVSKEIDAVGTSYTVDLQPGKYNIMVDELLYGGEAKYELLEEINIQPGDDSLEIDLTPVYEYKISGIIKDKNNQQVEAELSFIGPQTKELNVQGEYVVYLKEGNYSIRAINREEEISDQTKLILTGSTELDLILSDNVRVNPVVVYEEETKGDVPVIFKNQFSGYEITAVTNQDGEISLPLTPGEYDVMVDYETEEHVEGMIRDVRYHYDEHYEIMTPLSPTIELQRELVNSTLTGRVRAGGQYMDDVNIQFISYLSDSLSTSTKTNEAGAYSLRLAEGPYTVYVSFNEGQYIYSYLDTFKLNGESSVLNIELEDAVRINGQVTIDGETTSASVDFETDGVVRTFEVSDDGVLKAIVPEGEYTIRSSTSRDTEYGMTEYEFEDEYTLKSSRDLDIRLKKVKEYSLKILDDLETKTVNQGDKVEYFVRIKNTGNTEDKYRLTSDASWTVAFSRNNITIDPELTKDVKVSVEVDENATVGHDPIKIKVTSTNSGKSQEKVLPIEIEQVFGVELKSEITNKKYSNGVITYSVKVNNTGNGKDSYELAIINKNELSNLGWEVSVPNKTAEIGAHEEETVELTLTSTKTQPSKFIEIRISATSTGDGTISGTETYETEMPQLSQIDSIDMKDGRVKLEKEEFSLATWQWVMLVILVAVSAYYLLRKMRWI